MLVIRQLRLPTTGMQMMTCKIQIRVLAGTRERFYVTYVAPDNSIAVGFISGADKGNTNIKEATGV